MLVEINLLPKKEKKNIKMIAILLTALFLIVVTGSYLLFQGKNYNREIATLDNQISTTQQIAQLEQAKVMDGQVSNSVAVLESAVVWASEDRLKTVPIIEHVIALLPNRGFIQTISYSEIGSVDMTVQFDTSKEAAYYLKTLIDSEWFADVKLSSVSANQLESEESTNQDGQQTTESTDAEKQESTDSDSQDEDTEATSTEQTVVKQKNDANNKIVPRYIGQYQLTLSRDFINAQQNNASKVASSEGGEE
ncbi:type IV pilus assembly protein PilN [Mesobacillus persicus]|uniref:Type IV pilus assembly protein PilN n=1 Tax=Mesobacillus persicus TaxID=930146 RepID=A0A1H7XIX0_9BACI|nr:hypothetical protein [Mesobacillus persicus]SEM33158.1 type IV pilus assembly protein PilN [Mesobacillus persicus]